MSTDHDQRQERRERLPETDTTSTVTESVGEAETPDAVQAEKAARRGNDRGKPTLDAGRRARGVEWVRPTDLLARHGATLAGRGIDFEVELTRRTRVGTATGLRGFGDRARRLPPLSAFGRRQTAQDGPSRSAVGHS